MSNILAIGTTAANSSDNTVGTGNMVTLYLTSSNGNVSGGCTVMVELKSAAGQYSPVFQLDKYNPSFNLIAASTTPFRVRRLANGSVGVGVEAVGQA